MQELAEITRRENSTEDVVERKVLFAVATNIENDIAAYRGHRLAEASTYGARFRAVYVLHVVCNGDRDAACRQPAWAGLFAEEQARWERAASAYEPALGRFTPDVCIHCYAMSEPCIPACPLALREVPDGP